MFEKRRAYPHQLRALLAMLGSILLAANLVFWDFPVYAQPAAAPHATIKAAVNGAITQLKGAPPAYGTLVDVKRSDGNNDWAFGTVVLLTPREQAHTAAHTHEDMPEGRLWLARKTATGWHAAIDYTPSFTQWAHQAPAGVLSADERTIFAAQSDARMAAEDAPLPNGMFSLPWAPGQRWQMSSGPHSWSKKTPTSWSALDFAKGEGDGRVLASRDGLVYRPCGNTTYVMIKHADGWQTDYYHLVNMPLYQEGSWVESGRYLGNISTAVGCGGSATGPHVHFNIRYHGEHVAWNGRQLGGWTIADGARAYDGCATRGSERVCAGDLITNYDTPAAAYDSTHAKSEYSGSWNQETDVANAYNNTLHTTAVAGDSARFSFTGRRASLLFSLMPNGGTADVFVDGQRRETISYRAAETRRQVIKTWELGYGDHTIEVRANGDGPIDIDAWATNLQPVPPGAYDNTHAQWRYIGSWEQTQASGASQNTLAWSRTPGAAARIMFTGERINYVYSQTPQRGIAAITIDGVDKGYIDMYAPDVRRQQSTTFANLGPGVHVLHVTVTGQQTAAAGSNIVDVDRVIVPTDLIYVPVAMGGQ